MTITFIGTNPATQYLANKTFFSAQINYIEGANGNMHLIESGDETFLLDIKDTKIYNGKVVMFGVLSHNENLGNVAIQIY